MSDEFEDIARLFRPLTLDAPEALGLLDDAAAIPSRPGFDLIVTKDAMVEGVHFLPSDAPELVARKLLRVNLSDLAAKGAEPYGYFLSVAWPLGYDDARRSAFAAGLGEDQERFGLKLLGGDTVSSPSGLWVSATMLGWTPAGRMVRRAGAQPGDALLVTGTVGDGILGLKAARGELVGVSADAQAYLAGRYRLPEPRLALREALAQYATAAADVSDGLVADAGRIAIASAVAMQIDLERIPLSEAASAWASAEPDREGALRTLATGGDDYEIVCTAPIASAPALALAAMGAGLAFTPIGRVAAGEGTALLHRGRAIGFGAGGWRHA